MGSAPGDLPKQVKTGESAAKDPPPSWRRPYTIATLLTWDLKCLEIHVSLSRLPFSDSPPSGHQLHVSLASPPISASTWWGPIVPRIASIAYPHLSWTCQRILIDTHGP